jgi:hypothetical protein
LRARISDCLNDRECNFECRDFWRGGFLIDISAS